MEPKACFSLVCRTVAEVTAKDPARGSNLPFLLLFRVVMRHRNLAYPHSVLDTSKLDNFMSATFQSAKFEQASESIAEAFQVSHDDLDFAPRVTARKHIQDQGLDLNTEQTKAALNPICRQWLWLVRNVRLRCSVTLGYPLTDAVCPKGLAMADVATVHDSVKSILRGGGTMPAGCKALLRDAGAAQDDMFVEKVDLAWDTIHVVDAELAGVLQTLQERYTGGSVEGGAGDGAAEEDDPEPALSQGRARGSAAAGRSKRPPSGRPASKELPAKKRKEAEPVVSIQPSVRSLADRRSEERVQRALAEAVSAMQ